MIQFTYLPRWPWVAGGAVLVLLFFWLSYRKAKGKPTPLLRASLIALRSLAMGLVLLCLLDPQWVEIIKHQPKSRLAILLDTSRSMSIRDSGNGRLAAGKEWIQKKI